MLKVPDFLGKKDKRQINRRMNSAKPKRKLKLNKSLTQNHILAKKRTWKFTSSGHFETKIRVNARLVTSRGVQNLLNQCPDNTKPNSNEMKPTVHRIKDQVEGAKILKFSCPGRN